MNKPTWYAKKPTDLSNLPKIKGYDYEQPFDLKKFTNALSTTGIQATNLGSAIEIVKTMQREKADIYLSFTSNMISSGIRDAITYLVKNNFIKGISTSAGAIEEDVTQAILPHRIGAFDVQGEPLLDAGVGRIGNIYTTTEHYLHFERFIRKVIEHIQKTTNTVTPTLLAQTMGKVLEQEQDYDHESSYLYWAYKNKIPIYCTAIMDGAVGDIIYYIKKKDPNLIIDVAEDHTKIIDTMINSNKTGIITLGGGTPKHYLLNAHIFKEGADYAVYITTATEYDASDSGGNQEEAITWAKVKPNALRTKVICDASIAFPLVVAAGFTHKSTKK